MKASAVGGVRPDISSMSAPPMKALSPLPRSTSTRTSPRARKVASAAVISRIDGVPTMFNALALRKVSVATPAASSVAMA